MTQALLYGIHDREGRHILPPGGWCVDTVALSENPAPTDYAALRGDINWLVRLNWGYGSTGTIPLPHEYDKMAAACALYVAKSKGARIYIIGNEPNHEQERPNGVFITPDDYARCFVECRNAIKYFDSSAQVVPAPCAPYHANPVDWLAYWHDMLRIIEGNGGCDGIAVHAYTRSSDPQDISRGAMMGPPLEGQHSGFWTYMDALKDLPVSMDRLPVYITEFNELLEHGWHDANTGVVQAAYLDINGWNEEGGYYSPIQCLCLYRWPRYDKWHIEGKQGVIDDFRQAIGAGFTSPVDGTNAVSEQVITHLPSTPNDAPATAPQLPHRQWDERLTQRGVTVETPVLKPGDKFWRVVKAQWFDEQQAGGRHHIYIEAPNGTPFMVTWPSGTSRGNANGKQGFDAGNFPMSASLDEFWVSINDGNPSENVKGIGMGANGNPGIHTSTLVTFQLTTMPQAEETVHIPVVIAPGPTPAVPPATVPQLMHPIADPALRVVSQVFGVNPDRYARFGMAGHNGVDFAVPSGTPIGAVAPGSVVESQTDPAGYGEYVKIRHPWGESLYAHLKTRKVEAGDILNAGQVVGLSGNTGNSTGPHLHLGIRVNPYQRGWPYDGFVNPLDYLTGASQPAQPADVVGAIRAAAQEFGVDADLLLSQAWAESSFNPKAVSHAGAKGLMQFMDATWAEWAPQIGAADPFNPIDSARVGAAYMRWLLQQTNGQVYHALAAFVWGIGNVQSAMPWPEGVVMYTEEIVHGRDLLKAVRA